MKSKLPTILVLLSAALFAVVAARYVRGPAEPGPLVADHDHAEHGPVVVQLLRNPVDVPAFTVTDIEGRHHNSQDWRGKVVLVNFWATWCPPCLAEIPALVELQKRYGDQLLVVGISEDTLPVEAVKSFGAERGINYPIVMSTPELQQRFPGIVALPTTFVLDRDGRMVKKHVGLLQLEETEQLTRALAGLSVNARIEHVDDPGQFSAESASQITEIPGIDLSVFSPERRIELVQALNNEKCTCGCDLSVAKCRVDDPTCAVSLPLAREIVQRLNAQ